jgi:hypothetical protein
MVNVRVKFISYEWNNYQGASGKVVEFERTININDNVTAPDIVGVIISILGQMGYKDSWAKDEFSGRGLISVSLV